MAGKRTEPAAGRKAGAARKGKKPPLPPAGKKRPRFDISLYPAWCKNCGICADFCPKKVLDLDARGGPVVGRAGDCTGCQECVLHCPDFAIQVTRKRDED